MIHVVDVLYPIMLAQPLAVGGTGGAGGSMEIHSLFDFAVKGGWAMIPIGLCSLLAMALIGERLITLRRRNVVPAEFLRRVKSLSHDRAAGLEATRKDGSLLARVIEAALKSANEPRATIERQMEETGAREAATMRKHMRLLSSLPQVATMLGLLGTVFGMIKTFQAVALSSEALGKAEMLAKGIFEAWTCTAAGLLVAIPVLVAYHYLQGRVDGLTGDLDRSAADWYEHYRSQKSSSLVETVDARGLAESPVNNGAPVAVPT